jgi:hypothetical protein
MCQADVQLLFQWSAEQIAGKLSIRYEALYLNVYLNKQLAVSCERTCAFRSKRENSMLVVKIDGGRYQKDAR